MKPHKWKKEIIAWANGESVEVTDLIAATDKYNSTGLIFEREYCIVEKNPDWDRVGVDFRIKNKYPTTSLEALHMYQIFIDNGNTADAFLAVASAVIKQYIIDTESKKND